MARVNGKSKRAERVARPQVGRTKPARNWQTLFGPPPADEAGAADEGSGRSKGGDAANPIARGVELGYRVMDEYVKQGARVAGLRGGGGARASEAGGAVLPQLTERMFQYASDFASVWLEAMGVMMRNGGGPGAANGASATVWGGPPAISIFCSLPCAVNATKRESGDQNGLPAPSVPVNGCAIVASSGRSQSCCWPAALMPTNARR